MQSPFPHALHHEVGRDRGTSTRLLPSLQTGLVEQTDRQAHVKESWSHPIHYRKIPLLQAGLNRLVFPNHYWETS